MFNIREMQIKKKIFKYFTPTKMVIIRKRGREQGKGNVEKLELSCIASGSVKRYNHFGKQFEFCKMVS